MNRKWSPVLEFLTLGTMATFGTFIVTAIFTILNNIANLRLMG